MTFDDVMKTYGAALKRVAAVYTPPGVGREDLEQEIALAIYQALGSWRGDASLKTYLYRIAHNCGLASLRGQMKPEAMNPEAFYEPSTPEELVLARDRYEQLGRGIRALQLKWRQPLTMRLDGLSYEEIAQILELETSTVGVRIHRATKALQSLMNKGADDGR